MKWIASKTGGKFINLNIMSHEEAINELKHETLNFLGIKTSDSVRETYPSITTAIRGNFSIAGIMDAPQAEITLLFGYGNKASVETKVKIDSRNAANNANIHRVWAQKKIEELDMRYEKNKAELTELGQQFGIVTRNTSLIVLETLQDYITYRITPPAELLAEYNRWRKGQEERTQREQKDLLENAKKTAAELKKWWDTDFKPVKPKYPKPDKINDANVDADVVQYSPTIVEEEEEVVLFARVEEREAANEVSEVVVTAFGRQARREADASAMMKEVSSDSKRSIVTQPTIKLTPIKQDGEYMKAMTGNTDADYIKYLELRGEYINTPAFYFDIADWFFRHNDRDRALRILTSIAELELENASLLRLLGYRLKEYGEYELEVYICNKVIQWRPMEPQSYRDYALALADAGRKQEALNMLYSVITQSYAQNISRRSSGIEEVVVTELNSMIATGKQLNTSAIDKELIKAMPVDVRVVINWNMNSTDIDLHVTDPNGETCFYSHRATAIGGRISSDITQGYGPEQFMLKKAVKGKYKVSVNYYGDTQVKAEGPSTIMVEMYTGYSGGNQQRQVTCLQMTKENKPEGKKLIQVAEFEF
jgi:tetratricopeptide (TPR) repeat protein